MCTLQIEQIWFTTWWGKFISMALCKIGVIPLLTHYCSVSFPLTLNVGNRIINIVNIMFPDALTPCVARTSAPTILTMWISGSCLTRERISTTFVMSVWRNDINCKYSFMFMNNLAHKGLNHPYWHVIRRPIVTNKALLCRCTTSELLHKISPSWPVR